MANQAEKKRLQKAAALKKWFGIVIVVLNVVYLACHFGLFAELEEGFYYNFGIHSVLSAALAYNVISSQTKGYDYEYVFDVLVLNWVVQLGSLYSSNAWYLFYIVPIFAAFKIIKFAAGYFLSNTGAASEVPVDAATQARLEKKQKKVERKQARQGVRVG